MGKINYPAIYIPAHNIEWPKVFNVSGNVFGILSYGAIPYIKFLYYLY